MSIGSGGSIVHSSFEYLDSPSTTSALTYRVRVGPDRAATIRFNGSATARFFGGVSRTTSNPPGDQSNAATSHEATPLSAGEVVEAQSLNDLVSNAVVQPTLISQKVLKDPAALSDRILIEDSGSAEGDHHPADHRSRYPIDHECRGADRNGRQTSPAPMPDNRMVPLPGAGWWIGTFIAICSAIIGTTYGAGDGTTTFAARCQRSVVAGLDAGAGRVGDPASSMSDSMGACWAVAGGTHANGITVNQMPVHSHTASTSSLAPMHPNPQRMPPTG